MNDPKRSSVMVLDLLLSNIDKILRRITPSHLDRYDTLQRSLLQTDVSADREYQRTFNGYYKMQRRNQDWYGYFFSLLEREKRNTGISFRQVLEEIYSSRLRVEPSFSSKLIATIRPELPVYDKHVRQNLSLQPPGYHKKPNVRVGEFIRVYSNLESEVTTLTQNPVFTTKLRPMFDKRFPSYAHLTDTKKLDLLLWKHRQSDTEPLMDSAA